MLLACDHIILIMLSDVQAYEEQSSVRLFECLLLCDSLAIDKKRIVGKVCCLTHMVHIIKPFNKGYRCCGLFFLSCSVIAIDPQT